MKASQQSYPTRERLGMFYPIETQGPAPWRLALMGICLTLFSVLFMIGAITVIGWVI